MITVQVNLTNGFDSIYEDIEITREEILEFACEKVKNQYIDGHWTGATGEEIEIKTNI